MGALALRGRRGLCLRGARPRPGSSARGRGATSATAKTGSSTDSPNRSAWNPRGPTGSRPPSAIGSRPTFLPRQVARPGRWVRRGDSGSAARPASSPFVRLADRGSGGPRLARGAGGSAIGRHRRGCPRAGVAAARGAARRRPRPGRVRRGHPPDGRSRSCVDRRSCGAMRDRRCSPGNGTSWRRCWRPRGTSSAAPVAPRNGRAARERQVEVAPRRSPGRPARGGHSTASRSCRSARSSSAADDRGRPHCARRAGDRLGATGSRRSPGTAWRWSRG